MFLDIGIKGVATITDRRPDTSRSLCVFVKPFDDHLMMKQMIWLLICATWFRPEKLRRFGDCLPTIGGLLGTPKTNWRDPAQERLKTSRRKWEVFLENLLLVTRAGFLLRSFAFKEKQLFVAGADCLNCVCGKWWMYSTIRHSFPQQQGC